MLYRSIRCFRRTVNPHSFFFVVKQSRLNIGLGAWLVFWLFLTTGTMACTNETSAKENTMAISFYDLETKTPAGKPLRMKEFEGKVVLIVNTATKCGLAPQFEGLETLHQNYKDKGLVVLGFPCDQFGGQEPETNETVEAVCKLNHGVSFQLTEKIDVNGCNEHPIFTYLKNKKGGFLSRKIKWNFTKFLIDRKGNVIKRYAPTTKPESIEKDILKLI